MNWLQPDKEKQTPICYGIDPNRNYDAQWMNEGASSSPCNDFYAGPKPFSEPETKALAKFLDEYKKSINVCLYFDQFESKS